MQTSASRLRKAVRKIDYGIERVLMLDLGGLVARHCSPVTVRRTAVAIGWLLWLLPWNRAVREHFRTAFPDERSSPAKVTREWMALPYRDYMLITARRAGRAGFLPVEARHEMSPAVQELFDSGDSVLIAMCHLSREALLVLFQPGVLPWRMLPVVAELPDDLGTNRRTRARAQFAGLLDVALVLRADTVLSRRGSTTTARELVERSKEPGWALNLHIDATPPKRADGWFERPFASESSRRFATGTARLARLTHIPTAMALPDIEPDGSVVVLWSDPITPPDRRDRASDVPFMSALLDDAERAVGRWPGQYTLPFRPDRRWDPELEIWIDIDG
ncbi:MAG: hypothetical protein QNM02_13240 [Acidimicrobiia bacterium]|nr:hypothetical protein [Acidimicrobiia bacterium]